MTTYAKSALTIESILEAAAELFIDNNYADVTISEIAKKAAVSKGALYHHFDSKESLYVAMMLKAFATIQLTNEMSLDDAPSSCRARMKLSLLRFLELPEQILSLIGLVRRDINIFDSETRNKLVRVYQQAVPEHIERLVKEGVEAGEIADYDPRLLSWMHVAMVEVGLQPYSQAVIEDREARAQFIVNLFFDGVAK